MPTRNEYLVTVELEWNPGKRWSPDPAVMFQSFRGHLQNCYDQGGVAGHFNIVSMKARGDKFIAKVKFLRLLSDDAPLFGHNPSGDELVRQLITELEGCRDLVRIFVRKTSGPRFLTSKEADKFFGE